MVEILSAWSLGTDFQFFVGPSLRNKIKKNDSFFVYLRNSKVFIKVEGGREWHLSEQFHSEILGTGAYT